MIYIVILVAILIIWLLRPNRNIHTGGTKYHKENSVACGLYQKRNLLTKTEYQFWMQLVVMTGQCGYYVCPKVRLEDIAYVSSNNQSIVQKYRGYIKSRHVDFLICDSKLHILCGIELDDDSHGSKDAKQIDALKNDVFTSIGIPLYRIKPMCDYSNIIKTLAANLAGGVERKGPVILGLS